MARTTLTLLALLGLGGCYSLRDPLDDPDFVRPKKTVTSQAQGGGQWRRTDGSTIRDQPMTTADSRPAPTVRTAARVPTTKQAPVEGPALPEMPPSMTAGPAKTSDDPVDPDLVQATMVKTSPSRPGRRSEQATPRDAAPPCPLPKNICDKECLTDMPCLGHADGPPLTTALASGPGAGFRLVNSKRIAFSFEIKDHVSTGPAVEVWGTQDMKSWKKYELVTHAARSCVVEVKDDGVYGFRLQPRSGEEGARPVPGEAPQVWVAVDTTRPAVKLLGAELNDGATRALVIRWTAKDANLGPRPITLCYAERTDGPWVPIAANVENTGRYEWVVPPGAPSGLYLRAQAADMMGNVATAQTANRVLLPRQDVVSAVSVAPAEPAVREPETTPARLVLPPVPPIDTPKPAPVERPRPQVSILSVEPDKN